MAGYRALIDEIKAKASIIDEISKPCDALPGRRFEYGEGVIRGRHCGNPDGSPGQSALVDTQDQRWKCFKCDWGGDIIDLKINEYFPEVEYEDRHKHFNETIRRYAKELGISIPEENPIDAANYAVYQTLDTLTHHWHDALLKNPAALEWVKAKWGFSQELIERFRLGLCDGITQYGIYDREASKAGIDIEKLLWRIIFPYVRGGLTVWLTGRAYHPGENVRHYNLSTTDATSATLFNYDTARRAKTKTDPLFIFEGPSDAITAHGLGMRAVATGGARMFTPAIANDFETLAQFCEGPTYIVFDGDEKGKSGARTLARNLIPAGFDPIIITLPVDEGHNPKGEFTDLVRYARQTLIWRDGKDPALESPEWTTAYYAASGCTLLKDPRTGEPIRDDNNNLVYSKADHEKAHYLPNLLIEELPTPVRGPQVYMKILEILGSTKVELAATRYIESLARKVNAKISDLVKIANTFRKENKKKQAVLCKDEPDTPFAYAQDYRLIDAEKNAWEVHTVTRVTEKFPVDQNGIEVWVKKNVIKHLVLNIQDDMPYRIVKTEELQLDDKETAKRLPPEIIFDSNRWTPHSTPYSYAAFIEGECPPVNVADLYERIYSYFDRYLYLPEPRDKHLCILYILWTYIYTASEVNPYLYLIGLPATGKSTVADLCAKLAFNSLYSSSITTAAVYRIIDPSRGLLILNEGEKLEKAQPGTVEAELNTVLNAGYNKTQGTVARCEGADFSVRSFSCFAPIIIASTKSLLPALRTRCLKISCVAKPKDSPVRDFSKEISYLKPALQEIKDELRVWALIQAHKVFKLLASPEIDQPNVHNRDSQIWTPMFALARYIDQEGGQRKLLKMMHELAQLKIEGQQSEEASNSFWAHVYRGLYELYLEDKTEFTRMIGAEEYICAGKASEKIRSWLLEQNVWGEDIKVDFRTLTKHLRTMGAIADKKGQYRQNGKRDKAGKPLKDFYLPFNWNTLETHVRTYGIENEAS